jgi:hypothetical protein
LANIKNESIIYECNMDIYKLVKKREKKQDYKDELFNKILQQCHRRIEFCSNSGDLYSIFTIPNYVIGFPLFNKVECCEFLIKNLNLNGFKVQSYADNYIYITWSHVYESYKENKEKDKNLLELQLNTDIITNVNTINNIGYNGNATNKVEKINSLILNQNNKFSLLK